MKCGPFGMSPAPSQAFATFAVPSFKIEAASFRMPRIAVSNLRVG
jgi:hypothetical protein